MSEPIKKTAAKKRTIKAKMPAGNSPAPSMQAPVCGHDGHCSTNACAVRYVGPTSQISDHHATHFAQASTHIWSAAVITGLALVVTGAIAYQSVKAESTKTAQTLQKQNANRADIAKVIDQLNRIERVSTETRDFLKGDTEPKTDEEKLEDAMPKQGLPKASDTKTP